MIVVADTTPLVYLSSIGHLELLRLLYSEVVVPRTVWNEAVAGRPAATGVRTLLDASWLVVSDEAEIAGVETAERGRALEVDKHIEIATNFRFVACHRAKDRDGLHVELLTKDRNEAAEFLKGFVAFHSSSTDPSSSEGINPGLLLPPLSAILAGSRDDRVTSMNVNAGCGCRCLPQSPPRACRAQ